MRFVLRFFWIWPVWCGLSARWFNEGMVALVGLEGGFQVGFGGGFRWAWGKLGMGL